MVDISKYGENAKYVKYCTVAEKMINTPSTQALLKWGQFDRAKPTFKMLLVSWTETESTNEV